MIPRTTVEITDDEKRAIERVLSSGQFVKGQESKSLEQEFAEYQNVKFAAAVNSGTSALHLAILALDIKQGDEVLLPPNTFAATVNSIVIAGARPVFVDIDPTTFLMDPNLIEEKITSKTKAIIPVNLYGLMCDIQNITKIAKEKNIAVIEDACQSHGAESHGYRAGNLSTLAAFSFFPTKNITVGGDGGIVVSNDEDLIIKIKALRDHGRINGKHVMAGLNNRLSEILAAVGRSHLTKLDGFNQHRREIAQLYEERLGSLSQIELPREPENFKHVYHLYTIKTSNRDELKDFLKENNIGSTVMYKDQLNELDYITAISGNQDMPVNKEINTKILSLPISGTLPLDKIEIVCKKISEFYS